MMTLPIACAPLSFSDLAGAAAVLDAAFDRAGMLASIERGFRLQPEHWLCARHDGRVVGVAGAHSYGQVASIGPMAVHPAAQRHGVGEKLLAELVAQLDRRGCSVLFLDASTAGQRLYPKLGFLAEGDTLRLERACSAGGDAKPAAPEAPALEYGEKGVVRQLEEDDLEEVIAFDAPLFGADRGSVIRAYYAAARNRAFVAVGAGGRLAGYLIADAVHVGPWVAASPAAAAQLLDVALDLSYDRPPMLTCPDGSAHVLGLLARCGFVVTERLLHMRRGGTADPRQVRYLYAQASLSLG